MICSFRRFFQTFILAVYAGLLISCSKISDFNFSISDFMASPLTESVSDKTHFYSFTREQRVAFSNFYEKYGDGAVFIQFGSFKIKESPDGQAAQFSIGFFYESELSSLKNLSPRPVVSDSFENHQQSFAISFCAEKEKALPAGFFIKSDSRYSIDGVQVVRGCIGHDFTGAIPVFAFGPNGGQNDGNYDFSGGSLAFSSVTNQRSIMPVYRIQFENAEGNQKIAFGGETLSFTKTEDIVEVPASALKYPFSAVSFADGNSVPPLLMMVAGNPLLLSFSENSRNPMIPIKVDPGLIMNWPINNWRGNDFELYEWDRFDGVLIMDISTYAVQDDFFKRLAFFVEKAGYRGKLMKDEDIKALHGYNAHDYRAESLGEFFEKVRETGFQLNERELLLREILIKNGVIEETAEGKIVPGKGAVISISQESTPGLRRTFVAHEGWHGIYFVDDEFRNAVASVYYTLDSNTLRYLKRYFQVTPSLNYDIRDDYLMKNEFMAYMLQRPVSATGKYFVDMAGREHSQKLAKEEADYVIETGASGFISSAALLDQYVSDRWKLNAGRVWLITR